MEELTIIRFKVKGDTDYIKDYKKFLRKMKANIVNDSGLKSDILTVEKSENYEDILDSWNNITDAATLLIHGEYYKISEDDEGIHLKEDWDSLFI